MRRLLPALFFVFVVSSRVVYAGSPVSSADAALCEAIYDRMDYLERAYGIKFDRGDFQRIAFGIPKKHDQTYQAEYVPADRAIYVNTGLLLQFVRFRAVLGEGAWKGSPQFSSNEKLKTILDHELGHVLADQMSRRLGGKMFPDPKPEPALSWTQFWGHRVVSEGIGNFFGYTTPEYPKNKGEKYLPTADNGTFWFTRKAHEAYYGGGYWLVYPILKRFGMRGLEYLLTHPFDFPIQGNAREAARAYQEKALLELETAK